jgi:hypothetical protein
MPAFAFAFFVFDCESPSAYGAGAPEYAGTA